MPCTNASQNENTSPICVLGGNESPQVETVLEQDDTLAAEEYDPMVNAPDLEITTLSYVPFHEKNEHWGDPCDPSVLCKGLDFIHIYGINCNGISDCSRLKYDKAFEYVKDAKASVFALNETRAN